MIQIDMQMPERCGDCFAMRTDEIGLESWCGIDETERDIYREEIKTKRPDWCPLKEQEAVPYKRNVNEHGQVISCGNCGAWFIVQYQKYCHECGFPVLWEGR